MYIWVDICIQIYICTHIYMHTCMSIFVHEYDTKYVYKCIQIVK